MSVSGRTHLMAYFTLGSAILLCTIASPIQAQEIAFGRRTRDCCQPFPCLTPDGATTQTPGTTPREGEPSPLAFENPDERAVARASVAYVPPMLGDLLVPSGGFRTVIFAPACAKPVVETFRVPSAGHGVKIADDDSPLPQDRVFLSYNYYNNVNGAFDTATGSAIGRLNVHREIFGVEKTFLSGNVSFEMRLPLNTLEASGSSVPGLGGTFTDVGDLSFVFKGILLQNRETGSLLSGGLAVTTPSGPSSFAGISPVGTSFVQGCPIQIVTQNPPGKRGPGGSQPPVTITTVIVQPMLPSFQVVTEDHDTLLQPFVGGIYNFGDFFVHGFSALDIPTASNDVTLAYQDVGVGYYLYRDPHADRTVTAIVPTLELHLNTPLNHRGSMNGPLGTPDWVDLTSGTTFELHRRSTLAIGISTPITGPKPYDLEALVQLNVRF